MPLTSPLHVMGGSLGEIWPALLGWTFLLLEKPWKIRALGVFWRTLWCYSCCRICPTGCWSTSEALLPLELPLKSLVHTKTSVRAKPASGKWRQQGFASKRSCWSRLSHWSGCSGCWKALQGWQRAVHDKMFIPALIMPFAASLCNSQLCVLQLAQNNLISWNSLHWV